MHRQIYDFMCKKYVILGVLCFFTAKGAGTRSGTGIGN